MSPAPVVRISVVLLIGAIALPFSPAGYADPPAWAPAHGWRKKHDPEYVGYTGKKWPEDYGVVSGHCNYETAGAVVGGTIGGAVGSSVGKGDAKPVAILVGWVIGAVIGARIGRDIEQQDRSCIAHSLELAHDRTRVTWDNPNTGVKSLLTPKGGLRPGQSALPCIRASALARRPHRDYRGQSVPVARRTLGSTQLVAATAPMSA